VWLPMGEPWKEKGGLRTQLPRLSRETDVLRLLARRWSKRRAWLIRGGRRNFCPSTTQSSPSASPPSHRIALAEYGGCTVRSATPRQIVPTCQSQAAAARDEVLDELPLASAKKHLRRSEHQALHCQRRDRALPERRTASQTRWRDASTRSSTTSPVIRPSLDDGLVTIRAISTSITARDRPPSTRCKRTWKSREREDVQDGARPLWQ